MTCLLSDPAPQRSAGDVAASSGQQQCINVGVLATVSRVAPGASICPRDDVLAQIAQPHLVEADELRSQTGGDAVGIRARLQVTRIRRAVAKRLALGKLGIGLVDLRERIVVRGQTLHTFRSGKGAAAQAIVE